MSTVLLLSLDFSGQSILHLYNKNCVLFFNFHLSLPVNGLSMQSRNIFNIATARL